MNNMPTPYWPGAGSLKPDLSVARRRNSWGLLDEFVGLASLHIDDEPDTASVVFELWIVQTLFRRKTQ
jgi:hypothetical protein